MEYICNCNKKFETQRSLNSHARFCDKFEKKEKKIFTGECECGKKFETGQSLNGHYSRCLIHRNGKPIVDRGGGWRLSPDNHKQSGKTLSNNIKAGLTIPSFKGKTHSHETKRNLSLKRIEFLENNPNSNIKWFIVSNGERDIKVQGDWELNVANWLNSMNIKWDRKRILFGEYRRYTPDFWLKEENVYLEVKGFLRDSDIKKMKTVIDQTGVKIKLLTGDLYKNISKLRIDDIPFFE